MEIRKTNSEQELFSMFEEIKLHYNLIFDKAVKSHEKNDELVTYLIDKKRDYITSLHSLVFLYEPIDLTIQQKLDKQSELMKKVMDFHQDFSNRISPLVTKME